MNRNIILLITFLSFFFKCNNPENKTISNKTESQSTSSVEDGTIIRLETKFITEYKPNFISEEGKFKARFSDYTKPKQKVDKVNNEYGTMEVYSFVYELPGISIFTVMYNDYQDAVLKKFTPQQIMNNVDSTFIERVKLDYVKKYPAATFKGNPTSRYTAQNSKMYIFKQNILVKNRLYQLFLIRFDHYPEPTDFKQYIYSFELIN
jgi:hypothetical protein